MGHDRKETLLDGETVEERDRQQYHQRIVQLEEYKRIRKGLPNPEIITDAEYIPPKTGLETSESDSTSGEPDAIKIFGSDSAVHIALVRETIKAAIELGVTKEVINEIKKKAA